VACWLFTVTSLFDLIQATALQFDDKKKSRILATQGFEADGRRNACRYSSNVVLKIIRSNNIKQLNLFYIQCHIPLSLCGDSEVYLQNAILSCPWPQQRCRIESLYPAGHSVTATLFRNTINGTLFVTQAKGRNSDFNRHCKGIWTRLELGSKVIYSCDGMLFFMTALLCTLHAWERMEVHSRFW